jgi:diguanylate cyclase (GGDEF)-like protein
LGTICVIDRVPRNLPQEKIEALRALSRQVMAQLELNRVIGEMDRSSSELQEYQRRLETYQWQLETANAALEARGITDLLTGLKNRRAFDRELTEELARGLREKAPVSLLLVGLDRFSAYADEFGHAGGDEVLREVAQVLAANARAYDVVARYGDEEFALILSHTDAAAAVAHGERMRTAVAVAPWNNRAMTISVGASTTAGEVDGRALLAQAEQAFLRARESGGSGVVHGSHLIG